jgi:hypothetical protein
MTIFRPATAILAGWLAVQGLAGCQYSHGKRVVWLRDRSTVQARASHLVAGSTDSADYRPVGEYSLSSSVSAHNEQLDGDFHERSSGSTGTPTGEMLDSRKLPESFRGSVGEPIESQQKLVPVPERKLGFWERMGNGFRGLSDLARGQRPVNALVVLPFKPSMPEFAKHSKSGDEEGEHSFRIPAFSLPEPESISQASVVDAAPEATKSGLVPHWTDYPANSGETRERPSSSPATLPSPNAP